MSGTQQGGALTPDIGASALSPAQLPSTPNKATAAANTAVTVTLAAVAGESHRLTYLAYSYSASPTGGQITITDGGTTIFDLDVTSSWEVFESLPPGGIKCSTNSAVVLTLAAGGAGIVGKLNVGSVTG
jgi:hypothetical protein